MPEIKDVAHTNFCDIGWSTHDDGRLVLVGAEHHLDAVLLGQLHLGVEAVGDLLELAAVLVGEPVVVQVAGEDVDLRREEGALLLEQRHGGIVDEHAVVYAHDARLQRLADGGGGVGVHRNVGAETGRGGHCSA